MKKLISAVALTLLFSLTPAVASPADVRAGLPRSAPPCLEEDGSTQRVCVWDARHRGNGAGRSLVYRGDRATFVSHKRAHRMVKRWRSTNCERVTKKDFVCRGWRIIR